MSLQVREMLHQVSETLLQVGFVVLLTCNTTFLVVFAALQGNETMLLTCNAIFQAGTISL
jgi:hypothetical protein